MSLVELKGAFYSKPIRIQYPNEGVDFFLHCNGVIDALGATDCIIAYPTPAIFRFVFFPEKRPLRNSLRDVGR